MTIGQRIKERRKELKLTQSDLALRMGYKSRAAICAVEKDKENLTTDRVRKFAEALETVPQYLMGWADKDGNIERPITTTELKEYQNASGKFFYNDVLSSFNYRIDFLGGKYYLLSNCDEYGDYHTRVQITENELDALNHEIDNFIAFRVGQLYNQKRDTLENALVS